MPAATLLCFAGVSLGIVGGPPQGAIVGRVLDPDGRPCALASVYVTRFEPRRVAGESWQTDAEGRFRFTVPPESLAADMWVGVRGVVGDAADSGNVWNGVVQHLLHRRASAHGELDAGDLTLDGRDFASRQEDEMLEASLRDWCGSDRRHSPTRELAETILVEIQHRPKERWIPVLESLWRFADASREGREAGDLELLTVLRRLQGKPDPLRVEWLATEPLVVECPGSLLLQVRLANRDIDRATFDVRNGGDYRSGRLERWTLEATDAQGRRVPAGSFRPFMGGGMYTTAGLAPGGTLDAELTLLHYLAPLRPGEYRLRAVYHDQQCIAPPESAAWRVVSTSQEIPLRVVPRRIVLTRAERDALAAHFAALDPKAPALLLDSGSAGKRADISSPTAPEEHLLAAGWNAVPVLFAALDLETLSPRSRAWAFALLYDITGLEDPLSVPATLGSYRLVIGSRSVGDGAWVMGGGGSGSDGGPEAKAQAKLAERWRALRDLVEVEIR